MSLKEILVSRPPLDEDGVEEIHKIKSWRQRYIMRTRQRYLERNIDKISEQDLIELLKQVKQLSKNVQELQQFHRPTIQTKGRRVYEKLNLEKQFMDKIVAIDVNKEAVVGIGDTIEQAYEDAISKSSKRKFYFRKVGQDYLFKV